MSIDAADVTAVILAGGRGTRLRGVHADLAKPMVPVRGRPFLYWLTLWLRHHGLTRLVYSTGHRGEQIQAWCGNADFPDTTRICRHEAGPLGTGGGLLNCLDLCGEWVLAANGDGLCMAGLDRLLRLRQQAGIAGALIGVPVADAARFGSLAIGRDGRLLAFNEKAPGAGFINGGFYLFRAQALRALRRRGAASLERDMLPEMIAAGADLRVVQPSECAFIDIGTPESLAVADGFIDAHLAGLQPRG